MAETKPEGIAAGSAPDLLGLAYVATFVLIWGGWIAGTRHAVTHTLDPAALGFLRFAIPALVFVPVLWRSGLLPRGKLAALAICFVGAGAPFFLMASNGMRFAPAADVGPLLPGTMPLIVALASALLFGEAMGRLRWLGFVLVAAGIAAIGGRSLLAATDRASIGHAFFLCGATVWAAYTIAFRRSGMSATEGVALVAFWSAVVLAPFGVPSLAAAVQEGHARDVAMQAVIQGLLSGVVAFVAFNIAIARIGASKAAAFVAFVPACAALIAIPVLDEWPDLASWFGIAVTGAGVVLASGALSGTTRRTAAG